MTPLTTEKFVLPVDPEHAGVRIAVVVIFFASGFTLYTLLAAFVPASSLTILINLGVTVAAAAFITQQADKLLKQRWKSGRRLEIDGDHIRLSKGGVIQNQVDGGLHVNVLTWRFEITKKTRIPKGWYMVALALHQDDTYLPVYTFVSPDDFEQLPYHKQYARLQPRKQVESGDDLRLAGQQRRLHTAEDARWMEGGELTHADYVAYVNYLRQRFPNWMPTE